MNQEIGLQFFILAVGAFVLFKGIMKLPKKLAIGFIVIFFLSTTTVLFVAVYYPEKLI
jgi:hypothetical protein